MIREYHHAREFVRCDVCRDFAELTGPDEQRAAEEAAFAARHAHATSELPPSMEPKPKKPRRAS